jgi:uncharacterized protein YkwD
MVQITRRSLTLSIVPVIAVLVATLAPTPAYAKATVVQGTRLNSSEAALLAYVNKARSDAGIAALRVTPGTTDVARRWSLRMAQTKKLEHNPDFGGDVGRAGSPNWSKASENVGYASACDPKQLFDAYMNSAGHRKNIMNPAAKFIGIGSVDRPDPKWSCGILWNTMNFVDSYTTKYGASRAPAWGLRVDQYAPGGGSGFAGFEYGRDVRMTTRATGTLAKSTLAYDKPSSSDNAARLNLTSGGTGAGTISWDLRDAWSLSGRDRITLKAGLYGKKSGRSVTVELTVTDHFGRQSYIGSIRVPQRTVTQSLPLPEAAKSFKNTLKLRISNDAVRKGGAAGSQLVVYSLGVS